jgi:hypothetical protein
MRKLIAFALATIVICAAAFIALQAFHRRFPDPAPVATNGAPAPTAPATPTTPPAPTKTDGCVRRGPMPDPACTPGAVFAEATKETICMRGYAKSVRDVSSATKKRVFRMYGETPAGPGSYEVDHLISLELGGSNDIANLWPEPAAPNPGFHEKDEVENWLHKQVCSGAMPLAEAQRRIAADWMGVYREMHAQ